MATRYPEMEPRGPKIDDARVARFEAKIAHRLPDDFREFLLEVNGGVPEATVDAPAGKDTTTVQLFYGLDPPDNWMNLESCIENLQLRDQGRYPSEVIPIANDGFGNKFVLAVGGDRRGEVFFQALDAQPERRHDTEWHRTRQFKHVAGSFAEFLDKLVISE